MVCKVHYTLPSWVWAACGHTLKKGLDCCKYLNPAKSVLPRETLRRIGVTSQGLLGWIKNCMVLTLYSACTIFIPREASSREVYNIVACEARIYPTSIGVRLDVIQSSDVKVHYGLPGNRLPSMTNSIFVPSSGEENDPWRAGARK